MIDSSLRALSLWQPWAWLVVHGLKDVENRSWQTNYRGPLVIQAGLRWDDFYVTDTLSDLVKRGLIQESELPRLGDLRAGRGKALGYVDVKGCKKSDGHRSPWANGTGFCFELGDARTFPLMTLRGRQGLFSVPDHIAKAVSEQRGGDRHV